MSNLIHKNKHLTFDDRLIIQNGLRDGLSFKAIAIQIGKDQTTVSKEIKRHIILKDSPIRQSFLDGTPAERPVCPKLLKVPFVCNPCEKHHRSCSFQKHLYQAKHAQDLYDTLLSEARTGIPLNKESFYSMDNIVSEGIKSGQHLYHISKTNNLGVSKSTIYRHLHRGYLSVSPLDFPRVVKFKPRHKKKGEFIPKASRVGRTYDDFLSYVHDNQLSSWVEMDTVIGTPGGKVILTLDFTFCNFMTAILLTNKTAVETADKFKLLKFTFAAAGIPFGDIFPLLLTDYAEKKTMPKNR